MKGRFFQALSSRKFDHAVLLSTNPDESKRFKNWLKKKVDVPLEVIEKPLKDPTNHGKVYEAAVSVLDEIKKSSGEVELTFQYLWNPAMHSVRVFLAKSGYGVRSYLKLADKLESGIQFSL